MSVSRSPTRLPARSVAYGPTSDVRGGYDSDALDYFARAENLGGSFDLSSINATYTESYVKTAISDFVAGCKADSIWSKLTEVYLLAGVTFDGLMAKLKYDTVAALTNVNFVSGDLLAAGSGAGLKGDISSYLITNLASSSIPARNSHIAAYMTGASSGITGSNDCLIGYESASNTNRIGLFENSDGSISYVDDDSISSVSTAASAAPGLIIGTLDGADSDRFEIYRNGSSASQTINNDSRTGDANPLFIFALSRGGVARDQLDATISLMTIGTALADTEAANLSSRVNTLMTALGANVY